jgi:hypothetical protein
MTNPKMTNPKMANPKMNKSQASTDHDAPDQDRSKGAVESEDPSQPGNNSMQGQLSHRDQNPLIKGNDTDFPEPGENPEHSGEPEDTAQKSRR